MVDVRELALEDVRAVVKEVVLIVQQHVVTVAHIRQELKLIVGHSFVSSALHCHNIGDG